MNISERISARAETMLPARARSFSWKTFGVTRLALRVAVLKTVGLTMLLFATLHLSNMSARVATSVLDTLLVQTEGMLLLLQDQTDLVVPALLATVEPGPGGAASFDSPALNQLLSDSLMGASGRAQLYGNDGVIRADSARAYSGGPPAPSNAAPDSQSDLTTLWSDSFGQSGTRQGRPAGRGPLREVLAALGGVKTVRHGERESGDLVIAIAAPVLDQTGNTIGAVRMISAPGQILDTVNAQEAAIVSGFVVALILAVLLSLALAATISRPLTRLARAAERIKRGSVNTPIPALNQQGEIGDLSRVLHEMTLALYSRIDTIDAFAGEVAHELKNPLTSLRGAVEVLPRAKNETSRQRLLDVIAHDVNRLDRLISDISAASKLDAELNRYKFVIVDLRTLLRTIVDTQNELAAAQDLTVKLNWAVIGGDVLINGNDSRLGQVFTNLIENARSFSPEDGVVIVTARRYTDFVEVTVEDEGPGIDEAAIERIFERFYTDRPHSKGFGNNSGLGLAICRQIVEAHGGEIFAENRYQTTLGPDRVVEGARFTVRLPVVF